MSYEAAFMESVLVNDTLQTIDWKIFKDTKRIGRFKCQRAEADVRGRHYVAWFTAEIPVSNGPWKLYGLPGMILDAHNSEKSVRFEFESIIIPAPVDMKVETLTLKEKQKSMGVYEFLNLREVNKRNFIKMLKGNGTSSDDVDFKIDLEGVEIFPEN